MHEHDSVMQSLDLQKKLLDVGVAGIKTTLTDLSRKRKTTKKHTTTRSSKCDHDQSQNQCRVNTTEYRQT